MTAGLGTNPIQRAIYEIGDTLPVKIQIVFKSENNKGTHDLKNCRYPRKAKMI